MQSSSVADMRALETAPSWNPESADMPSPASPIVSSSRMMSHASSEPSRNSLAV